ncbi:hypothetical protein [Chryseobacterium sp. SG20098]|uniref:hypothetical protein n=1 Tax=Chryseobacterium sp. SG20098 TaxID=3074145 RepID=UPI002882E672|nr:hypothetical protein [Chryseobacterium sp. SG20098]WNI34694.1 hypothetical protein RHP76_11925 [Chryseobacterium sp. SG20098]
MYRINNTARNTLITPDEVRFHSPSDGSEGERMILQNIIVAEERWIKSELGYEFYEDFINKKNVEVTASNKNDLLQKIKADYAQDNTEFPDLLLKEGKIINAIEFVNNDWYKTLWKQYLWKITAECVDAMTIVPSWLETTASGQQMKNPNSIGNSAGVASGSAKDVKFKMDNAVLERIQPLLISMHEWLCRHKNHFPLYKKACSECESDEVKSTVGVGWAFNIYED